MCWLQNQWFEGCTLSLLIPSWVKGEDERPHGHQYQTPRSPGYSCTEAAAATEPFHILQHPGNSTTLGLLQKTLHFRKQAYLEKPWEQGRVYCLGQNTGLAFFTENDARVCFFGAVVQKKSKGPCLSHCRASSCILFDKRCYKIFFLSSQPTSSNTSTQTNFPSRGVVRTTVQAKDTNPKTFFQLANQQADEEVSAGTAVLAVDRYQIGTQIRYWSGSLNMRLKWCKFPISIFRIKKKPPHHHNKIMQV